MKKIITVLILIVATFSLKAQTPSGVSVPIVTYKIDTTATSKGLTVPAPFYFAVNSLNAEIDSGIGFYLQSYSISSTDSSHINKIELDSIKPVMLYPMTIEAVDTLTLDGMVELYIKKNLEDLFGASNVSKME